ncbi:MAG: site-2 protease family protein [Actinobacteria bacterium]|nr:site-2 protease family protein [Actinomycetota bacterium]
MKIDLQLIVYTLIGLFIGVILHEYVHGRVADMLGDHTARNAGRLTLNPIAHIDPFGTVILPLALVVLSSLFGGLFLFGYAKPVPVNPFFMKKPKRDMVIVAASGPMTNFAVAFAFGLIGMILRLTGVDILELYTFLLWAGWINIFLAVFNLIPIPPLDGSHILEYFLSPRYKEIYLSIAPYGFMIILAVIFLGNRIGLLDLIFSPFERLLTLMIFGI